MYVIMARKRNGDWQAIPAGDPHSMGLLDGVPMFFETQREAKRTAKDLGLIPGTWRIEPMSEEQRQALREYVQRDPAEAPPPVPTMPIPLDPELIEAIDAYATKAGIAPKDAVAELVRFGLTMVATALMAERVIDEARDKGADH